MSQRSVPGCIERLWDGENRSLYYMEYQRAKNDILKASIREAIDYETSYYEFFDSMEEVISYLKKNSDKDEHERFEVHLIDLPEGKPHRDLMTFTMTCYPDSSSYYSQILVYHH